MRQHRLVFANTRGVKDYAHNVLRLLSPMTELRGLVAGLEALRMAYTQQHRYNEMIIDAPDGVYRSATIIVGPVVELLAQYANSMPMQHDADACHLKNCWLSGTLRAVVTSDGNNSLLPVLVSHHVEQENGASWLDAFERFFSSQCLPCVENNDYSSHGLCCDAGAGLLAAVRIAQTHNRDSARSRRRSPAVAHIASATSLRGMRRTSTTTTHSRSSTRRCRCSIRSCTRRLCARTIVRSRVRSSKRPSSSSTSLRGHR